MRSSGVKRATSDAYDQANSAIITNAIMHIDRVIRKTVVSCDCRRRNELAGMLSKVSIAREEDPKRGVRSVDSCALRLPLSTWPDNSSLLIVIGVGDGNAFGLVLEHCLIQTLLPNMMIRRHGAPSSSTQPSLLPIYDDLRLIGHVWRHRGCYFTFPEPYTEMPYFV
jgi:hypothetical protein